MSRPCGLVSHAESPLPGFLVENVMITVEQIRSRLGLAPHPEEGGFFAETYRSRERLPSRSDDRYAGERSLATAIYYLLTPDTVSAMHRLPGDEIFHFYLGNAVEMVQLAPHGAGQVVTLGPDLLNGMQPQVVVPGGTWQGSRLLPGGSFALLGATMSPGFDYEDYESGRRDELVDAYPNFRDQIIARTP